eukprot:gene26733-4300_t
MSTTNGGRVNSKDKAVIIKECANVAKGRGHNIFAIQDGNACFIGTEASKSYARNGVSKNCGTNGTGVFKPSFSCTPVNSPDDRRAICRYLFSRYNLKMMDGPPKFGNSMYFNRTLMPPHGAKSIPIASGNNMIFRAKYNAIGRHHQPRHLLLLMTRAIGSSRSGSIVLINRCVDSCLATHGLFAPTGLFDEDTLIMGEMEDRLLDDVYPANITNEQTHRVFCATDVLVWRGRPVGVGHGSSRQQQCIMNATQRTDLLHTWYAEFESSNNNLVGAVHSDVEIVLHNNKVATQKDALLRLIFDDNNIIADDDSAIIADEDSAIIADDYEDEDAGHRDEDPFQPEETEYDSARLEPEAVRHMFYVRATHMPDVYELYREEVSASLSRSPDAFAGVRSMRDSLIMRSLFSASSGGGATLPQCMFVFNTVIGKWTPE